MKMNTKCYVGSEIGRLRRVILHKPTLSLERLTPSNCNDLLFDDVLDVEEAGKEHDVFSKTLEKEGVEVFFVEDLLADILQIDEATEWLTLHERSAYANFGVGLSKDIFHFLATKVPEEAARYLIGGITWDELEQDSHHSSVSLVRKTRINHPYFALTPVPNVLFTRDSSCWIYNGVCVSPMAKPARRRETLYMRAIYKFHPMFRDAEFEFWYGNNDKYSQYSSIEGGDVMVVGKGIVMIGLGERSTPQAVEFIAKALFEKGVAHTVIAIELPKARSSMHLDTILTMLDYNCFTAYNPVINEIKCWELTPCKHSTFSLKELHENIFKYLAKKLNVGEIKVIPTGGNKYQAEREQWNDANNVLAVSPGIVIGYEHNRRTIALMQDAGIKVLGIPGNQLGRGRGGARCMSCPIERDDLQI